ncbi:MAG: alpha/beta fold hydrolase [Spartobacteria bacterium]|nr:alpha/beta fold hydrolase [Spartobacteria bacterium]
MKTHFFDQKRWLKSLFAFLMMGLPLAATTLEVNVNHLRNTKGNVVIGLYTVNGYHDVGKEYKGVFVPPDGSSVSYSFEDLPAGRYAVTVYHDENNNRKLDKNFLGMMDTELGPVEYVVLGKGKPLLVLHGGGGGYDQAVILYSLFVDAGFSIICPSRPGYLRTPLSSGREITDQADLCMALLDKLGLEQAGVVGASAGGAITYELAIRYPKRIQAIVVIDGISMTYDYEKEHAPIGKVSETLFLSNTGMKLLSLLTEMMPRTMIKQLLDIEGDLTPQELTERTKNIMMDPSKYALIMGLYSAMYPYRTRKEGLWNDVATEAALKRISVDQVECPALILHTIMMW